MKFKSSKKAIEENIKKIFLGNPSPKEIKKIKKQAMSKKVRLGELRKKFCGKCYELFDAKNSKIKIKKPLKIILCKSCGNISRYKLK
jgi:RNase P subunit RPR2